MLNRNSESNFSNRLYSYDLWTLKAQKWKDRICESLVFKSGVAFVDQAILSATNFLISLVLIKTVPKEEYGYYSLIFAVSLFLVSIQTAIVTTPLAVSLSERRDHEEQQNYVAALYWGQFTVVIPAVCLGLAVTGALYFLGLDSTKILSIGSLCFAATGILLREFSRAYHFARESPLVVLKLDSCYVASCLSLIALAYLCFRITVPLIFVSWGISGLLTSGIFDYRERWKLDWTSIRQSYRENWKLGRWSLLGVLVTHIQSYCNLYLTGTLLSSSAVASVAASRLPFMPLSLIQGGWTKVAVPRGARLREKRQLTRFLREQVAAGAITAVAMVIYVVLLLMSSDYLNRFLFNKGYESSVDLIIFWAAINVVSFFGLNAISGLLVMKKFSVITKVNVVTMLITLSCNYVFIKAYGIKGGLAASLVGETLLAVALWWLLVHRSQWDADVLSEHNRKGFLRWAFADTKKGIPV